MSVAKLLQSIWSEEILFQVMPLIRFESFQQRIILSCMWCAAEFDSVVTLEAHEDGCFG